MKFLVHGNGIYSHDTLLEIVSGIKKIFVLSGIKQFQIALYKTKFEDLVFIPLSKSPLLWTPSL